MSLFMNQGWVIVLALGVFWMVWSLLSLRIGSLRTRDKPTSYHILRLREKSKQWASSDRWIGVQQFLKRGGFQLTVGEYLFVLLLVLFGVELMISVMGLLTRSRGLFVFCLIFPIGLLWMAFYFVQYRIDQRRRILQGDFIHCFSRLADFVHYKQVSDYEKIRRSLVGTRMLHLALVEEVYFRKDVQGGLRRMEEWIAFQEEKLMLRNALHEALYSDPELAQKSLLDTVGNLRARRTARWRREIVRIEFFALVAPRAGVGVFAVIMILSMWLVIRNMMGWS